MTAANLTIPRPEFIHNPIDAIQAAMTTFLSRQFGIDPLDEHLPDEYGEFFDASIAYIKAGDDVFASIAAEVASDSMDESSGIYRIFAIAMASGAEAGVFHAKGDDLSAWQHASHAALLFGVLAGFGPENKESRATLKTLMGFLSKQGVQARHVKTHELRAFAVDKYLAKQWASPRDAATKLKDEVMAEANRIGMRLSASNAQRTIAEWFRAADKEARKS